MNVTNISRRHLSRDLIEEILSKLPVKSLLRFRCVSKSWNSLLSSESFVKIHLENSRANPAFSNHIIFFNYLEEKPGRCFSISTNKEATAVKQYPMQSFTNKLIHKLPHFMKNCFRIPTMITVVGSCNGLVCFFKPETLRFYLCNPSTRTSIRLPRIKPWRGFAKCGFGFDEWSGAYKVFVVMHDQRMYQSKVYSSNTNAWRTVQIPIHRRLSYGPSYEGKNEATLASGNLHWLHWQRTMQGRNGEGFVFDIITFDLRSEEFGAMDLPFESDDAQDNLYGFYTSLAVLDGCLTLVHYHDEKLDVWVMMEYGVKESWIKIMYFAFLYHDLLWPTAATLCLGADGVILMTYGRYFFACDLKKRQLLHLKKVPALFDDEEVHLFVESLVCPQRFLEQHAL